MKEIKERMILVMALVVSFILVLYLPEVLTDFVFGLGIIEPNVANVMMFKTAAFFLTLILVACFVRDVVIQQLLRKCKKK